MVDFSIPVFLVEEGPNVANWLTFAVILVSAILAGLAILDARRTRDGQLVADLSRRWDEPAIIRSQRMFARYTSAGIVDLVEKIYDTHTATDAERRHFITLEAVPNFWETLGALEASHAVSIRAIHRIWGEAIIAAWVEWEPALRRLRDLTGVPTSYSNFEALAAKLAKEKTKGAG